MPPRKKKTRRRSRSFSVLNALEAYVYATILTEGVAGTSPVGLITGKTDLESKNQALFGVGKPFAGEATTQLEIVGADEISLGDIMNNPGLALTTMSGNFRANLAPMAIAAFTTSMTFRIGKRLLRKPISNINRNIMKPALGAGIRL